MTIRKSRHVCSDNGQDILIYATHSVADSTFVILKDLVSRTSSKLLTELTRLFNLERHLCKQGSVRDYLIAIIYFSLSSLEGVRVFMYKCALPILFLRCNVFQHIIGSEKLKASLRTLVCFDPCTRL